VDILASRANGLLPVGVFWGYGSKSELQDADPGKILERPEQLAELVPVREGEGNRQGFRQHTQNRPSFHFHVRQVI
jgi:hypothetical protein